MSGSIDITTLSMLLLLPISPSLFPSLFPSFLSLLPFSVPSSSLIRWSLLPFPTLTDRFTEFLSGKDHVTMEERVDHDWSFVVTDSESDTVDYSDDEGNSPPASHR